MTRSIALLSVALIACWASEASAVPVREIVCYSGGGIIYKGESDPDYPVYLGSQDDHVGFVDRLTHKFTRVGGNCIVRWDLPNK